jgi:hypothetical protein
MAGPAGRGGKSVGRVTIRVVPDATRFREDLKKTLTRIEKSNVLKINVDADMRPAERTIKRFIDHWSGQEIHLNVDVNGATLSNARIAQAARPRVVPLNLEVTKASVAKVGAAIAALSGARMFSDLGRNLGEGLLNLDRSLPKMAAIVSGITSLAAAAIAAGGGIATLAGSLASVLAISALAPALIAGAGVSIATLMVALAQVGDRLNDLLPLWDDLKTAIGDNFWVEAEEPIRRLVTDLFPSMRAGLTRTATALGQWSASLADAFRTALTGEVVGRMFDRLVESIDIAAGGTDSFANALVNLGLVGSDYLPRLAQWIADLTERFDNFVGAAAADGRLKGWIDGGIESAKLLGSVLADSVRIIAAIGRAAEAAGGDGLATLAGGLSRVADALATPEFQAGLTGLFEGSNAAIDGVNRGLERFGQMLGDRSGDISAFIATGGDALGELLGGISDLLNQPAVGEGFLAFINGLRDGITELFDNIDPAVFGEFVKSLGEFTGSLATELGGTLGSGLTDLLPLISDLLDDAAAGLPDLAESITQILEDLPGALDAIVEKGPAAVDLFVGLVDAVSLLADLIGPLADLIAPVIEKLGEAGSAASALTDFFNGNSDSILDLGDKMTGFNGKMIEVYGVIAGVLAPGLRFLADMANVARDAFIEIAGAIARFVADAVAAIQRFIGQIGAAWSRFWADFSSDPVRAAGRLISDILAAFGDLSGALTGAGFQLIQGFIAGIRNAAAGAAAAAAAVVRNAVAAAQNALGGGGDGGAKASGDGPPKMATGGTILPSPGGTIVRVAEAGKAETIVDRGKQNRLMEVITARLLDQRESSGSGPVTVVVESTGGLDLSEYIRVHIVDNNGRRDQDESRGGW